MKTLILHNIISSNTVFKINSYIRKNKKQLGRVLVIFCAETEANRPWTLRENPNFKYKLLFNYSIRLWGKDLYTYFINPSILKELNNFKADRVIISGWDQFAYQLAYVWCLVNKKKVTIWAGSTVNEKSWRRSITLPLVKFLVKIADDYVAYGKRSKEYFQILGADKKNISVFLNDVNKDYFTKQARKWRKVRVKNKKELGLKTKFNFIYVGQLIERKGLYDLLESYKEFRKVNYDWGLVIVGYGKIENRLKEIVKEKNIEDVHFLGMIEQYDLPKIYTACDCLILPSTEEVWGLVVSEALYSGLKIIVGDKCGCAPDLVKEGRNGYTFESGNVEDLLQKMNKITWQFFYS